MWRTERYKKKDRGRGGKLRWSRWAMGGCQSKQCQTQTCSHSLPLSFLEIDVWLVTGGQTSWVLAEVKRHSFNHYWVASQSTLFLNAKQKSISILLCPDYRSGSQKTFFIKLFLLCTALIKDILEHDNKNSFQIDSTHPIILFLKM